MKMDPGSRGGRYFAAYGAGAASSKMSGEIVDAGSGEVLVRFTQARRSGGTWKLGGGSDLEVMRDTVHATAQDVAHILDSFCLRLRHRDAAARRRGVTMKLSQMPLNWVSTAPIRRPFVVPRTLVVSLCDRHHLHVAVTPVH